MARRRLRAVLFDVDDTLYSTTEFAQRARENSVRAMIAAGLALPREVVGAELEEVVGEFPSNFDQHYDALLLRLPAGACGEVNPAVIVASGVVAYHETKWRELSASADALEVMRRLAERPGLVVGVVTSGVPVKQAEKLVRLGVLGYVDPRAVFFAEQMGYSKDNPKLYSQVCRVLGLPPGECMYVGDHPVRDVDSPGTAGMVAVLYRGGGKYAGTGGRTQPDYAVQNFWDLLELIDRDFEIPGEPSS
jgi:putative hydrolase of the HAD superfamily